jgi:hypothetical protein
MELKVTTRNRVLKILAPEQLTEPFEDPLSAEIINKKTSMAIYGESIQKSNQNSDNTKKSSNDQSN